MVRNRIAALALIIGAIGSATPAAAWDRFSGSVAVDVIEAYMDGQFIVRFISNNAYVNLCSGPPPGSFAATYGVVAAGARFPNADGTLRFTSVEGVKLLYASLLAAKLSGRSVNVYANNDPASPSSNLCVIGVVDVL